MVCNFLHIPAGYGAAAACEQQPSSRAVISLLEAGDLPPPAAQVSRIAEDT